MVICRDSEFQDPNMARSSSSSDSEGSSTSEEGPQVTTRSERLIRKYQIKRSLILERIFAIEQVISYRKIVLFYVQQRKPSHIYFVSYHKVLYCLGIIKNTNTLCG